MQEGGVIRTTDYSGPFVYEDGELQFIRHPEGRMVLKSSYLLPRTSYSDQKRYDYLSYEYHLKDHLGNVRLTFTTDPMTDSLAATMEEECREAEREVFNPSYDECTRVNAQLFNHTEGANSRYSVRLSGAEGEVVGLAKSLPVLPGDTIEMEVYGKYTQPTPQPIDITSLLAWSLTGAFGLTASAVGEMAKAYTAFNELFAAGALITADDWEDDEAPKAYLNYILFDQDHKAYDMGFDQISEEALEDGSDIAHDKMYLKALAKKPGYIYIYLSNENPTLVDVYFPCPPTSWRDEGGDDFTIAHHHSPVIQADDYYPFGMVSGSTRSDVRGMKNDYLYNGKELQTDLNLDWYDYGARMYDGSLGRWHVVDPMADQMRSYSPYNYAFDNPVRYIDPDGNFPLPGGLSFVPVKSFLDKASKFMSGLKEEIKKKIDEFDNKTINGSGEQIGGISLSGEDGKIKPTGTAAKYSTIVEGDGMITLIGRAAPGKLESSTLDAERE